jgi:hypothetical protein
MGLEQLLCVLVFLEKNFQVMEKHVLCVLLEHMDGTVHRHVAVSMVDALL